MRLELYLALPLCLARRVACSDHFFVFGKGQMPNTVNLTCGKAYSFSGILAKMSAPLPEIRNGSGGFNNMISGDTGVSQEEC